MTSKYTAGELVAKILQFANDWQSMDRYAKLIVDHYPHKKSERFDDGEWVFEAEVGGCQSNNYEALHGYGRSYEEALEELWSEVGKLARKRLEERRKSAKFEIDHLAYLEKQLTTLIAEFGESDG